MYSSKVILVQLVVVACLAGLILPASANIVPAHQDVELAPQGDILCDICQEFAAEVKAEIPAAKARLIGLCKNSGSPEEVHKCEQAVNDAAQQLDANSPMQFCQRIGFCTKEGFFATIISKLFS